MTIEVITPKDEAEWLALRVGLLTTTKVPALFGCGYTTEFAEWHAAHDGIEIPFTETERTKWGRRFEASIAAGVAEDEGWDIRPMKEFYRDTSRRLGASFDFAIGDDGVLEIKNVDSLIFRDRWIVTKDGDETHVEPPPHIEFQVQTQLLLSRRDYVIIAAMIGGNRVELLRREPDAVIQDAILERAASFWKSVDEHNEPLPSGADDLPTLAAIFSNAKPGKVLDASERPDIIGLATQYSEHQKAERAAKEMKDEVKAQIIPLLGDHEKAIGPRFSISAGVVGPSRIEYLRKGYRNFRINWRSK